MTTIPDGHLVDGKPTDLESAKFTKDKETVDVIQPTAKLIGLTKEQLEQYRNDPFWKAVRYSLFIIFWLVWLIMFVGAILIVVMSPKCIEMKWPDKAAAYRVFTLGFKDSDTTLDSNAGFGDFAGIKEKLGELKEMGVNTIWPAPVLNYDKNNLAPESTIDLEVAEQLGGQEKFKEMIKAAHAKDMKVVVDLPIAVATEQNWVNKKGIKDGMKKGDSISVVNLKNVDVKEALMALVKKLVEWGVDGINLADNGLTESADLSALAKSIRELPGTEKIIIYAEKDIGQNEDFYQIKPLVGDKPLESVVDLVKTLHKNLEDVHEQSKLHPEGNDTLPKQQVIWRLGNLAGQRIDAILLDPSLTPANKQQISLLLSLVQLFIPGPISILYGEELGLLSGKPPTSGNKRPTLVAYPWDNSSLANGNQFFLSPANITTNDFMSQVKDEHSPLAVFKQVAKLRQHNDFMMGEFSHVSSGGLDIYLVKRYPDTTGQFALIVNWDGQEKELSVAQLPNELITKKLTLSASTGKTTEKVDLLNQQGKLKVSAYGAVLIQAD